MSKKMSFLHTNNYDVFLSYNAKSLNNTRILYETLTKVYKLKTWIDYIYLQQPNEISFSRIKEALQNSNLFIACITKDYAKCDSCLREFLLAVKVFKKNLLVILMERLEFDEIPLIASHLNTMSVDQFDIFIPQLKDKDIWLQRPFITKLQHMLVRPSEPTKQFLITNQLKPVTAEGSLRIKTKVKKSRSQSRADQTLPIPEIRLKNAISLILNKKSK